MIVASALETAEAQFRESLEQRNAQLEKTKGAIVALAEITATCGNFFAEMEVIVGKAKFPLWFAERGFACSLEQGKAYARFAARREMLSDSFRRTLLALPEVGQHDARVSEQNKLPKAQCPWLAVLMKGQETLALACEQAPLEQWPPAHREMLLEALRPMDELFRKLEELCGN